MSTRVLLALLLLLPAPLAAQTPPFSGLPAIDSAPRRAGNKSPALARVIGIVPGAGHMYAGETKRGFQYLGGVVGILVVGSIASIEDCVGTIYADQECGSDAIATATVLAAGGLWGWSLYDAGNAARRTNASRRGFASLMIEPMRIPLVDRSAPGIRLRLSIPAP